jgi:hypothetical protein
MGALGDEATTGGGVPLLSKHVCEDGVLESKKSYARGRISLDKKAARFRMWDKVGISG